MFVTWTIFYFCQTGAGRFAARDTGYMNFLIQGDLIAIRTKPSSAGLKRALTGWASGLPTRGPPG